MIAIKPENLTQNFKRVADCVTQGDKVLIARPVNENLVIITEREYNELDYARKQAALKKAKESHDALQEEALANGLNEMTAEEIDDIITEIRQRER